MGLPPSIKGKVSADEVSIRVLRLLSFCYLGRFEIVLLPRFVCFLFATWADSRLFYYRASSAFFLLLGQIRDCSITALRLLSFCYLGRFEIVLLPRFVCFLFATWADSRLFYYRASSAFLLLFWPKTPFCPSQSVVSPCLYLKVSIAALPKTLYLCTRKLRHILGFAYL